MSSSLLCPPVRTVCPCISLNLPWSNSLRWWRDPRTLLHCGKGQPAQPSQEEPHVLPLRQGLGSAGTSDTALTSSMVSVILKTGIWDYLTSPSNISHLIPQLLMHNSWLYLWNAAGCGCSSFSFLWWLFSSSLFNCDTQNPEILKDFQLRVLDC